MRDITILFTDLKGSTAMYDLIGDATAYYVVDIDRTYVLDYRHLQLSINLYRPNLAPMLQALAGKP